MVVKSSKSPCYLGFRMYTFTAILLTFFQFFIQKTDGSWKPQWILLVYHKTGHDLVDRIIQGLRSHRMSIPVYNNYNQTARKNVLSLLGDFKEDIVILHASDLPFDWNTKFSAYGRDVKIIHFVRDPYDMVMSGYLYHSQRPSPERWERNKEYHPCSANKSQATINTYDRFFAAQLSRFGADNEISLMTRLRSIRSLCNSLYRKYSHSNPVLFEKLLWEAHSSDDYFDGLRLEASRAMISVEGVDPGGFVGADVLRMAANAIREREAGFNMSKRFLLSEFPVDNIRNYKDSLERMFEFLMQRPPASSGLCLIKIGGMVKDSCRPFWAGITASLAASHVIETITHVFSQHHRNLGTQDYDAGLYSRGASVRDHAGLAPNNRHISAGAREQEFSVARQGSGDESIYPHVATSSPGGASSSQPQPQPQTLLQQVAMQPPLSSGETLQVKFQSLCASSTWHEKWSRSVAELASIDCSTYISRLLGFVAAEVWSTRLQLSSWFISSTTPAAAASAGSSPTERMATAGQSMAEPMGAIRTTNRSLPESSEQLGSRPELHHEGSHTMTSSLLTSSSRFANASVSTIEALEIIRAAGDRAGTTAGAQSESESAKQTQINKNEDKNKLIPPLKAPSIAGTGHPKPGSQPKPGPQPGPRPTGKREHSTENAIIAKTALAVIGDSAKHTSNKKSKTSNPTKPKPVHKRSLTHVTTHLLSDSKRRDYLKRLQEDVLLGPLLDLVDSILKAGPA